MGHKLELGGTNPKCWQLYPGVDRHFNLLPEDLGCVIVDLCNGNGKWPLFLYGKPGRGKSYAALCLFDQVPGAEFWSMPDFIVKCGRVNEGKEEWHYRGHGGKYTVEKWWRHITSLPLLILDDVAMHDENNVLQTESLFRALEARTGLPLVVTSNRDPDGIGMSYDDRIRSRLGSGTRHELVGDDLRYRQNKHERHT